jgi:hypothetical protein
MDPKTVYVQTEIGKQRFEARDIPNNLRYALLLVNGRSTLEELLIKGAGLENLEDSFEMLEQMGLMAPLGSDAATQGAASSAATAAEQARGSTPVKPRLMALASKILGNKADKVLRKIEETVDSDTALRHTIETCGKIIRLTIDEKKADEFLNAAKAIMSGK